MAHRQFSLDEGLESVGFGRFQWMLLVLSGIGFCATTVELILVSLIKGLLMEQWPKVGNEKFALLTSVTFAGEIIGGFFWAAVSDRLGRRKTFAGTALVAAVSGMLGSVAPCFYTFTITRFFLGAAMGGCLSIDIIYFLEFVPTVSRGFRTTFIIFMGICACTTAVRVQSNRQKFSLLHCPRWLVDAAQLESLCVLLWGAVRPAVCGAHVLAVGVAAVPADARPHVRGQARPPRHGTTQWNLSP